jgi:hypothetical protein
VAASNFACIGLRVETDADYRWLLREVIGETKSVSGTNGSRLYNWQDPSGARLTFAIKNASIMNLIPSFAGNTSVAIGAVLPLGDGMFLADIVDDDGQILTRATLDVVDRQLFEDSARTDKPVGRTSLVALGVDVVIFDDAETFLTSPASLLERVVVDRGSPARWSHESFLSYGSFASDNREPSAMLNGTVLSAELRTVALTEETFVAATVRTSGFEVDVCFPQSPNTPLPVPGNILGGTVYLVAAGSAGRGGKRRAGLAPWLNRVLETLK